MEGRGQQVKGANKINYRDKNLEYIQKLKEKKQKELEEKMLLQRKDMQRRQTLKRKILQQASKNRENKMSQSKQSQEIVEETKSRNNRTGTYFESLPKISGEKQREDENQNDKKNYQQRYLTFLQSLTHANKSKKEIQQAVSKKKDEKVKKLREELGYTNIQSKLRANKLKKDQSDFKSATEATGLDVRSHSAEKFESLIQIAQNQMPKTNKNFKKKNEEYCQKIKKKRAQEQHKKQEEMAKKEKLKEKLKEYVMVTVKKNVMDGIYDDELDKKQGKKGQDENENEDEEDSQQDDKETPKRKKRKMRSFPYVTDLSQWKKKNRLEDGQKVFIITGGYKDLKNALIERGWVRNPDFNSTCFDYKFTLQQREIDFNNLQDFQMINHFQKNAVITTKLGLTKSLRNCVWINDISEDNFYPKCFDLNDQADYVAFSIHFKVCKALSILKIYVDSSMNRKDQKFKNDKNLLQDLKMRTEVAVSVCMKNIEDLDDIIDKKKIPKIITDKQWEILASDELNEESLAKKKHQEWLKSIDCKFGSVGVTSKKTEPEKKKKKKKDVKPEDKNQDNLNQQEQEEDGEDELLNKVQQVLDEYKKKYPQYHLTGHNNIWILKPAGLSRGRGITCYNHFVQIEDHIKCKQSLWIAQKYIQNPLVILKRKFDIRQWVLITDFNPLVIWFYEECYVRFSAIDYDAKEVSNKFIHLTNNSIGAYSKEFQKSHIKGNMFFQEDLQNYLKQLQGGRDIFQEMVRPQMKEIVKQSLMCALDGIENRKNTHEMYGYDFMIDENYKVWLIEVNSSPSMDYSTHVTTKLVKEVLADIPKVIIDHAGAPKKEKKHVDTGKWKRIYKGMEVAEKTASAGLNLCLEGIPMKKPKRPIVKVQNYSLDN